MYCNVNLTITYVLLYHLNSVFCINDERGLQRLVNPSKENGVVTLHCIIPGYQWCHAYFDEDCPNEGKKKCYTTYTSIDGIEKHDANKNFDLNNTIHDENENTSIIIKNNNNVKQSSNYNTSDIMMEHQCKIEMEYEHKFYDDNTIDIENEMDHHNHEYCLRRPNLCNVIVMITCIVGILLLFVFFL